jgi:hypothetical protein
MALHGSAVANLSPILFKGNNRALGVNVLIQQDESGSMGDVIQFYSNGTFIGALQDALIAEKIGDDLVRYPNIYAYFGVYSRNPSTSFTISNPNGRLTVSQAFMRGEATGASTIQKWTGGNYFSNSTTHVVDICTDVIGNTTGGRLSGFGNEIGGGSPKSEDVHGSLWSIWTSPNAISTGTPGRFGSVIGSNIRKGSTTIIITNSDEQDTAPGNMINQLVNATGEPTLFENFPGLTARRYSGYFGQSGINNPDLDNVNYTDNLIPAEGPIYPTEFNGFFRGSGGVFNDATWLIEGQFLAPTTGTYTFFLNTDDAGYLWIGDNALQGYTRQNSFINNGGLHGPIEKSATINLVQGTSYPIRIIFGNQNQGGGNPTELTFSFSGPGIAKRTNGTGYFFSRNVISAPPVERAINGQNGEMIFRRYRVIALSSYVSNDGFDGVLFYGPSSAQPFGYVAFTGPDTYTITRSANAPNWTRSQGQFGAFQIHDTLTLASETRGGIFKLRNVFTNSGSDRRVAFSRCLAAFIADTV